MGRHRKPLHVLEDTGAFRKHPERRLGRMKEAKANGPIGEPPAYFDAAHRAVWAELVGEAAPGVLGKSDGPHLELTTRLMCRMRADPARVERAVSMFITYLNLNARDAKEMREEMTAALTPAASEMALLMNCLAKMGMNPSSRIS